MKRLVLLLVLLAGFAGALPAIAANRVALVVGNGNYQGTAALANPARDAAAMAAKLKTIGFTVILAADVDRRDAITAIDEFSREIEGAEIALLFFAGHGIQIGGQNFLLPTDVSVESERALRYSAIDIQEVIAEMERRAQVAIAILDACRDNPFVSLLARSAGSTRSAVVERGLGPMLLSGRGALVAYAAAAGDVASDGAGEHSPFTAALLEEIDEPNVEVGLMFRRVTRRVIDETHGDQRPELLVRLVDEVYLNLTTVAVAEIAPLATEASPVGADPGSAAAGDLPRQALAADPPPGPIEGTFFGNRAVHAPPWASDITVPAPSGWRSAAVTTMIEATVNDTYSAAQPLTLAAAVEAKIAPRGDVDWYYVQAPTAGELGVDVDPAPAEIDLYARVWDSDHNLVADWQGAPRPGGALAARFPLPRPGGYWIEMADGNSDMDSAASFVAKVDFLPADDPFEPNNNIGAATPIPGSVDLAATIYPRGDADWYQVWLPEPGLLTVSATNVPETLETAMRVWDLNGNVVRDWVVPPRSGGDTFLEAEIASPGIYLIETADANSDAASVVPLRISVRMAPVADAAEPNNAFGDAVVVAPTSERRMAIFPRGDTDWLAVDVDHPGELTAALRESPENLDIYLRIWSPNKDVLRDWFGPARAGGDVDGFADLPLPGRYFIEISDGNSDQASPGLFELSLAFTPEPDQYEPNNAPAIATPLTPGGEILFNILPRADVDWFSVETASAGELSISIDEGPENLDLHYRVWNSNRQVIRDWVAPYRKGGLTEGFADLPAAGAYYIEVADGNSDDRSVAPATLSTIFTPIADFTLEPNNSFGQARPVKLGAPLAANILPRSDADWYLLEAPGPGAFNVTVDEVDEALDIYVRIWDAEFRPGNWMGPPRPGEVTEAEIAVPAAGTYRLEVTDGNNDARSTRPFGLRIEFR